jgi:hypothetical protein
MHHRHPSKDLSVLMVQCGCAFGATVWFPRQFRVLFYFSPLSVVGEASQKKQSQATYENLFLLSGHRGRLNRATRDAFRLLKFFRAIFFFSTPCISFHFYDREWKLLEKSEQQIIISVRPRFWEFFFGCFSGSLTCAAARSAGFGSMFGESSEPIMTIIPWCDGQTGAAKQTSSIYDDEVYKFS